MKKHHYRPRYFTRFHNNNRKSEKTDGLFSNVKQDVNGNFLCHSDLLDNVNNGYYILRVHLFSVFRAISLSSTMLTCPERNALST